MILPTNNLIKKRVSQEKRNHLIPPNISPAEVKKVFYFTFTNSYFHTLSVFLKSLRIYVYDVPNGHNEGACLRHNEEHNKKEIGLHSRANMLLLTHKTGISKPFEPVWGDKFLYAPVVVEMTKGRKSKDPNWNHFLGFGHQFLLNASRPRDGLNYYFIGVTISTSCMRDRNILVYVTLAVGGKKMLMNVHKNAATVQALIDEVQSTPLRSYSWGTVIPGSIVPHVVGTILEAGQETQELFFDAVKVLFSQGGVLPLKYYMENKKEVIYVC